MFNKQYTAEDIIKLLQIVNMSNTESLDRIVKNDNELFDTTIGDFVKDPGPTPDDIIIEKDISRMLIEAVEKLSPRQQLVIKLRFGLETRVPMTLDEVGQMYGITRERIRQIEVGALKKLKWILMTKYKFKDGDLSEDK